MELRQAARRLLRAPAFTMAAIVTLALAIGVNASIFAIVERVVLRPLPYPESSALIQLEHAGRLGMGADLYAHYSTRARTLDGVAIWDATEMTLTGGGDPERLQIARVTPSLASVLRVQPDLGRWLRHDAGGGPPDAVLSHRLWARRYGSDPAVIGQPVTLNGVQMHIAGVMPAGFAYPAPEIEVWIDDERLDRLAGLGLITHGGVARLRGGATLDEARAELTGLIADLPAANPDTPRLATLAGILKTSTALSLKDATTGGIARRLWIVLAAVGLVLLVACANVANLFLVRMEGRQRELAVRRALGASQRAIGRYILAESVLLAVIAGGLGLGMAAAAVRLLATMGPDSLPRLHEIRIDGVTVVVTMALSVVAGLAFGSLPILRHVSRGTPLQDPWHSAGSTGRFRVRQLLMGVQIAVALVLITASGLMVRSFQNLTAIDPGFEPASTLTFRLGLPPARFPDHARLVAAHRGILERLSAVPGVESAALSNCLPLENERCVNGPLRVEGRVIVDDTPAPGVLLHGVTAGFFDAMGMRLLRGRGLDTNDLDRRHMVVVVNEALADAYFPGEDPLGRRVTPGREGDVWGTIVGVVANTSTAVLNEERRAPKLYMPLSVTDAAGLGGPNPTNVSYVVRGAPRDPLTLLPFVRGAIEAIDRDIPIAQPRLLQDVVDQASAQMALTTALIAFAGAVALTLGLVGIYALMSYIVSQRAAEIGVRVALGAAPGRVSGLIVREGGLVAVAGILVGVVAALGSSHLFQALLYGVDARDPGIFVATTAALFGTALLACWLPARRAARLNPIDTLRLR